MALITFSLDTEDNKLSLKIGDKTLDDVQGVYCYRSYDYEKGPSWQIDITTNMEKDGIRITQHIMNVASKEVARNLKNGQYIKSSLDKNLVEYQGLSSLESDILKYLGKTA